MVYIAYLTELILQICDYAQKRRILRENCKYALDKNFHCHFCPRQKAAKFRHPDGLRYSWQNTLDWLSISARFRHWICLVHAEILVTVLRVVMTNLQHAWAPSPLSPITIKTWPGITNCIFIICTTLLNGTGVAKEADYCQSLYSIFLDLCLDKEAGQSIYKVYTVFFLICVQKRESLKVHSCYIWRW